MRNFFIIMLFLISSFVFPPMVILLSYFLYSVFNSSLASWMILLLGFILDALSFSVIPYYGVTGLVLFIGLSILRKKIRFYA